MVLHDVADRSQVLVERAAALDAEFFGHRDLHTGDERAVPQWFEEGVGEAEIHEILDGLLPQKVVDAEH